MIGDLDFFLLQCEYIFEHIGYFDNPIMLVLLFSSHSMRYAVNFIFTIMPANVPIALPSGDIIDTMIWFPFKSPLFLNFSLSDCLRCRQPPSPQTATVQPFLTSARISFHDGRSALMRWEYLTYICEGFIFVSVLSVSVPVNVGISGNFIVSVTGSFNT